ncbi:zinc phosphodiesterase ELAC protein 1 [Melospiza georgiana]|uniref:zinc phosphodiesterase ELAC protein 1 n=1 Tax=Melospiza georgiana TaxID=44398 RepID=UPI0025AD19CD|nr:zinc phosphodiesterase ELAC protein 1 [Melospiza georgiana]XP_057899419.1 zinc phosphodiesterase ELAC protein 1 [Melospiza georgiana]
MSLDVTFLGTGAAFPSPARGASALVLRRAGQCWLFDCGEGTQTQLMRSHLRAAKITKIFITHLHGDHMFGLPGLLCTLTLQRSPEASAAPIDIYGPLGLRSFLWRSLELSHSQPVLPCRVHELVPTQDQCPAGEFRDFSGLDRGAALAQAPPGTVLHLDAETDSYLLLEDEELSVRAFRLFHRVPSFGFVVEEKPRPGKLKVHLLQELGVPPGALYGELKRGRAVELSGGVTVRPRDVLSPPVPGRKVCVLGDCAGPVGPGARRLCGHADLLVHEATLGDGQQDAARQRGHSTPGLAARFALECRARRLVLTHFSQRYQRRGDGRSDIDTLRREAEAAMGGQEVTLAEDFMTIEIPMKNKTEDFVTTENPMKQ